LQNVVWTNLVGVSAAGNSLAKTSGIGWNAGAVSTKALGSGNGYLEFTATGPLSDRIVGFAPTDHVSSYLDILFGLELSDGGNIWLIESGQFVGVLGSYAAGDRFRVAIESGVARYYRNGVLFYQGGPVSVYPLWAGAALFHANASVGNAVIS